jgi:transposase
LKVRRCIRILNLFPRSAIEWALASGPVIDNLKNAIMGNFSVIGSLISVLEDGQFAKRLVDRLIDRCIQVLLLNSTFINKALFR